MPLRLSHFLPPQRQDVKLFDNSQEAQNFFLKEILSPCIEVMRARGERVPSVRWIRRTLDEAMIEFARYVRR